MTLATEQFALETGHSCNFCHLDESGGGELTTAGDIYLEQATAAGEIKGLNTFHKLVRLLAGYLHLLFAVLWFGTILYVHIVLKPAYAAHGLPRGEKLVGILSFWVVGVTGIILTLYRIQTWQQLFGTNFGILLLIKVSLYLLMLVSAIFVIKIIGPHLKKSGKKAYIVGEPFTHETLQQFDGKAGRPYYFAYKGKVYDASGSKLWPDGQHMKRHQAGADLTKLLSLAPHDTDVLDRLPIVGEFDSTQTEPDTSVRQFNFIAYMNLIIVFIILLLIALWRW